MSREAGEDARIGTIHARLNRADPPPAPRWTGGAGWRYDQSMIRLDDRDIAILKVLAREGRLSKADLARRINLSPTPCWERLKRLEKAGIIEGYNARIALKKTAPHVTVFVTLELDNQIVGTAGRWAAGSITCWRSSRAMWTATSG
jgi:hypothetical protein